MSDLSPTQNEFRRRLYRWSLQEWRREIDNGFPLLRLVSDSSVRIVLEMMGQRDREGQLVLADALTKAANYPWLDEWGESYSEQERALAEARHEAWWGAKQKEWLGMAPGTRPKALRPAKIISLTREPLERALMAPCEKWEDGWLFKTPLGKWTLRTLILMEPMERYIQVLHRVWASGSDVIRVFEGGGFPACLGAGALWEYRTEADLPAMGEGIGTGCAHFLQAMPALLEGLEPN